MVKETSLFAL